MAKARLDVDVNVEGEEDLAKTSGLLQDLGTNAKTGVADLNTLSTRLNSIGSGLTTLGAGLTAGVTLPIVGVGAAALKLGANAVETQNLVNESFGSMADQARAWSQSLSDSLGLNRFELQEQSASFQLLAENMGLPQSAAFETATSLTELAADLNSFLNLSEKGIDPIQALQSGLVGNSEALRSLNVFVNDATLRQIAYEKGITETNRQLTQQEKFLATLEAITQQTAKAQGDLGRTLDEPVNKMRQFGNRIREAGTDLGIALLPVFEKLLPLLDSLVSGVERAVEIFSNLSPPVKTAVVAIAGLAAAIGPLLAAAGVLVTAIGSVVGSLATISAAGLSVTGILGSLATTVGTVLVSAVAAAAVGFAAFKLTDTILEATGLRDVLTDLASTLFTVTEAQNPMRDATDESKKAFEDFVAEQNAAIGTSRTYAEVEKQSATAAMQSAEQQARLAAAQKEAEQAARAHEKAVQNMVDKLGGAGLAKEAALATEAIQKLGGNVSQTGIQSLSGLIDRLHQDAQTLSPELAKVALELDKIAIHEGLVQLLSDMEPIPLVASEIEAAIKEDGAAFDELGSKGIPVIGEIDEKLGGLPEKAFSFDDAMGGVNDLLSETRGLMNLFGVESDSAFGKVIDGATRAFDTFNSIIGIIDKVTGALGGLGGAGGGLSNALGGLFGGGGGGGGLGGLLGGLGGIIPGGGLAALGIGGAIAGIGALAGVFSKEGSAETTAESIGINFDSLSADLQDKLQNVGEQVGDFATGIQLNIGEVVQQAGLSADEGLRRIVDTLSFVERGQLDAATASQVMSQALQQIPFEQLGQKGHDELQRLLSASERLGVELPQEITQAAQSILNIETEGMGATSALDQLNAAGINAGQLSFDQLIAALQKVKSEAASAANAVNNVGAGGGGAPEAPRAAQGGFFTPRLSRDTTIRAHRGEAVNIGEPDRVAGRGGGSVSLNLGGVHITGGRNPKETAREVLNVIEKNIDDLGKRAQRAISGGRRG